MLPCVNSAVKANTILAFLKRCLDSTAKIYLHLFQGNMSKCILQCNFLQFICNIWGYDKKYEKICQTGHDDKHGGGGCTNKYGSWAWTIWGGDKSHCLMTYSTKGHTTTRLLNTIDIQVLFCTYFPPFTFNNFLQLVHRQTICSIDIYQLMKHLASW